MSPRRRTPAALLALAAAVLGLALGVPLAQAFFIDTRDAEISVAADRVSDAVTLVTRDREPVDGYRGGYAKIAGLRLAGRPLDVQAAHGSERSVAVVLGWRADWARATEPRAFTLTSKRDLRGVSATVETVEGKPSGALQATISAIPTGDGGAALAVGDRRQVDLRVLDAPGAGPHLAIVALRLAWADGSFLTKRVPVVWFGGADRPSNAVILGQLGDGSAALDPLRIAQEDARDAVREAAPATEPQGRGDVPDEQADGRGADGDEPSEEQATEPGGETPTGTGRDADAAGSGAAPKDDPGATRDETKPADDETTPTDDDAGATPDGGGADAPTGAASVGGAAR